jgi:hypothetical protein
VINDCYALLPDWKLDDINAPLLLSAASGCDAVNLLTPETDEEAITFIKDVSTTQTFRNL